MPQDWRSRNRAMAEVILMAGNLAPKISLQYHENVISIGRGVIQMLGEPNYITFKVSSNSDSIIIFPCSRNDSMSFKVPDDYTMSRHKSFRIVSKQFVSYLVEKNSLDGGLTHYYRGTYYEKENALLFSLKEPIYSKRIAQPESVS